MKNKFYREFEVEYDNRLPSIPLFNNQICHSVEGHKKMVMSLIGLVNDHIIGKLKEEISSLDNNTENKLISSKRRVIMEETILHCIDIISK